jgi:hypothetical protein
MQPAEHVTIAVAGQNKPHVDFQVSRYDDFFWTIKPVFKKAKAAVAMELGLDDRPAQDLGIQEFGIVRGCIKSNALLNALRPRGFSILYHGPAGPITL